MSKRKKNNIIIGGLCAIVLLMAVGYAAFASQLKINGTSSIGSEWKVLITDITSGSIVGGASNAEEPTHTATTATFKTNLVSPGDSITYTVTVENQGTIDATLTSIDVNTGNNSAIEFETSGIEEGDNLLQGESDELYVKVTYSNSVTSQPENTNSTFTVTLNYTQAGIGDDGVVLPTETVSLGGQEVETVNYGDGLYTDEYETGRYVYKGTNPNNYIEFNNGEMWRIIAKETDGTYKVIRNEIIENRAFDIEGGLHGSNEWNRPADLNTYLNSEYYNTLDLSIKDIIVLHNFGIGAVIWNNTNLTTQIANENGTTWKGNIGLISASDYIRANSNEILCGNINLQYNNKTICKNTNWMFNNKTWWTISPMAEHLYNVIDVYENGESSRTYAAGIYGIRPVVYLTSNITLSGSGTSGDPYVLSEN